MSFTESNAVAPVLAVHAGAGTVTHHAVDPAAARQRKEALAQALREGWRLLSAGDPALDAVVAAVVILEECDFFNAGIGSVLTADGRVQMDAAVMDGDSRRCGAVAAVTTIRNPVRAARAVMELSPHVLLTGDGAEAFAAACRLERADPSFFITPLRREQLRLAQAAHAVARDHDLPGGTVGAVARDLRGSLAAATSTGGMTNKLPGRVGDSPLIGSGTWADSAVCAVSATGDGEAFIRAAFAHEVDALVRLGGMEVGDACRTALEKVGRCGGTGGCIAVDCFGNVSMPFTTAGMYRGLVSPDGRTMTAIFGDEEPR